MSEGQQAVLFSQTIEGVGRAFAKRLRPETLNRVKEIGFDFDNIQAAYPLESWDEAVRLMSAELYPGLPEEAAWRKFGYEYVEGYLQVPLGKALLMIIRAMGLKRSLARMQHSLRNASNFTVVKLEWLGERHVQINASFEPAVMHEWKGKPTTMHDVRCGIIEGSMSLNKLKTWSVEMSDRNFDQQSVVYRMQWED